MQIIQSHWNWFSNTHFIWEEFCHEGVEKNNTKVIWVQTLFDKVNTVKTKQKTKPFKARHKVGLFKAVDTIGNCQILVFTVGVPQHIKITNL